MNQRSKDLMTEELEVLKLQYEAPSSPKKWWSFFLTIGFWRDVAKIVYKYLYNKI